MKVQMREIIQAIPALSKITGGDLSLRLAYQLKRNIAELQKEADFFRRGCTVHLGCALFEKIMKDCPVDFIVFLPAERVENDGQGVFK